MYPAILNSHRSIRGAPSADSSASRLADWAAAVRRWLGVAPCPLFVAPADVPADWDAHSRKLKAGPKKRAEVTATRSSSDSHRIPNAERCAPRSDAARSTARQRIDGKVMYVQVILPRRCRACQVGEVKTFSPRCSAIIFRRKSALRQRERL